MNTFYPSSKSRIMNKSRITSIFSLIFMSLIVSSCSAIEGIFKMGMSFGIFLVLAILVIVVFIIMQIRKSIK